LFTLPSALGGQDALPSAAEPDPEALRRALEEVFSQPAFQRGLERADEATQSPWQVLLQRLLELLLRLHEWLEELHVFSPILYWIVFAALVALLLALLAHIGWTLRRAFRVELSEGERPAEARARAQRFSELREQANRRAAQGDWRAAARLFLLSLLALIEERKFLQLARGWTNREILRRLALPEPERAALEAFRMRVEGAWYGGHALDRAQLAELSVCVDRCAEVLRASGQGGGSA
jgi:hypothetical protein